MQQNSYSKYLTLIIHVFGWLGYFLIQMLTESHFAKDEAMYLDSIWWIIQISIILYFYLNYLLLIPRLLLKKKYLWYGLIIAALGLIFIFGIDSIIHFTSSFSPSHRPKLLDNGQMPHPLPHKPDKPDFYKGISIFATVFVISTALRMTSEWFKAERQKQTLENEKLIAELSALKAQINPHFVFNVLNNICSLARKKSDETEIFIIKLSQLIRYNLYDDKGDKILLEKEIDFLTHYIDLQKMRLGDSVVVEFNNSLHDTNYMIEPMLLFPFIENAFKHGISYSVPSEIKINIGNLQNQLNFSVINHIMPNDSNISSDGASGIGLTNVRKRLSLLYGNKHNLEILQENEMFVVNLKIDLS